MASEAIGAFFVTFLYLTQTEEKTKLSSDPAITTLIIASAYMAAMLMVSGPDNYISPLNQGYSGPNTAEFKIYDDKGELISANQWNLATGFKATIIIVKE